ncbi:nicotinate-nucleotide--dimethylbenzimidazole phosphoribosyltransferase [Deinococcus peraridilitoris]|uniref:Nicotinate-nucleotide--dimethylbenzimidazole phosphoribosyltransferase n=1 Tax=Deinococcus peraridilitoris (strain DSM 19664 / LMG 22246 / CIP 109416 / KR-200) TaxID=937777 RepID=K9ZZ57_DEIPD|nr:nicotinate-nucleotide--dimethylbenzimidazole phosphoribosyltransferase [Deinococcus peraridilitoris]AFZ66197.1 nicotinate-nucleotide--dimethylbenzimidazole phosphoribosyltransferase [Deinococcus peraridilitoris DSM 19664]
MSDLEARFHDLLSQIVPVDSAAAERARARQDQLTKPPGALGALEDLSVRLAAVFGSERPTPERAAVIVCAGDHGVTDEGVSAFPASVTPAMVANFLMDTPSGPGGAAVNALSRSIGARVYVLDVGVNAALPESPRLIAAKVRSGTRNLRREAAMTREETLQAVFAGVRAAEQAIADGADLLVAGEMGIGNTTPAAAVTARLLALDPADVTGRGTGVDNAQLDHKITVIRDALARQASAPTDPLGVLADLGGLELAAMLGVMLAGARARRAVILDGFVEGAAALIAVQLQARVRDYLFPAGLCAERGHGAQLAYLGFSPLFDLSLRLGEGTGGVLAVPLFRAAAASLREMLTFQEAGLLGD